MVRGVKIVLNVGVVDYRDLIVLLLLWRYHVGIWKWSTNLFLLRVLMKESWYLELLGCLLLRVLTLSHPSLPIFMLYILPHKLLVLVQLLVVLLQQYYHFALSLFQIMYPSTHC